MVSSKSRKERRAKLLSDKQYSIPRVLNSKWYFSTFQNRKKNFQNTFYKFNVFETIQEMWSYFHTLSSLIISKGDQFTLSLMKEPFLPTWETNPKGGTLRFMLPLSLSPADLLEIWSQCCSLICSESLGNKICGVSMRPSYGKNQTAITIWLKVSKLSPINYIKLKQQLQDEIPFFQNIGDGSFIANAQKLH